MYLRVCRIYELSENDRTFDALIELFGLLDSSLHTLCAFCKNDLSAVCLKKISSLNAHGVRQCKDCMITLSCRNCCKTDSGISRCRLNDSSSRRENSLLLRIFDHCKCDSILNRSRRIQILQLSEDNRIGNLSLCRISAQLKYRCLSYKFQ